MREVATLSCQRCIKLDDVSFMKKFFVRGFFGSIGDYFVEEGGKFGFYFELLSFGEGDTSSDAAAHRAFVSAD